MSAAADRGVEQEPGTDLAQHVDHPLDHDRLVAEGWRRRARGTRQSGRRFDRKASTKMPGSGGSAAGAVGRVQEDRSSAASRPAGARRDVSPIGLDGKRAE